MEQISGKRLEGVRISSRRFLCFLQGKRISFGAEPYVSVSENIRFREGKRTHQTDVPGKTKRRLVNSFHSFEKPFLFCIFQDEIYLTVRRV
jgi:hypothetical protein